MLSSLFPTNASPQQLQPHLIAFQPHLISFQPHLITRATLKPKKLQVPIPSHSLLNHNIGVFVFVPTSLSFVRHVFYSLSLSPSFFCVFFPLCFLVKETIEEKNNKSASFFVFVFKNYVIGKNYKTFHLPKL